MDFVELLVVSLMPVLKLLVVIGVGLFLALDGVGLLGRDSRHHLNNLVFYVFSPVLVATNLAETITLQSLLELWFMPVNILLTFIIGSALAWILVKITRPPHHLQGIVIGCCSAGNLGNMLLIIIPAVCEESNSPFGNSSACSAYGLAYASLSMAVGAIYIWSYVYIIVEVYAKASRDSEPADDSTAETFSESGREALLIPNSAGKGTKNLTKGLPQVSGLKNIVSCAKRIASKIHLKEVLAPQTIAAIIGFIIGTVSPIRKFLIADTAPLRVIVSSASVLGEAAIPCMTLVVGANLLRGLKGARVGTSLIVGIIVVRYIIMPLLGLGIIKAAGHYGLIGSDSLYQFILMLQYALPPAMAVGTMTELFEVGQTECSVIMFWCYAVATFSITLWSAFYLWILV